MGEAKQRIKEMKALPIEIEYRSHMQALAKHIDTIFNGQLRGIDRKVGFVLMTFPTNQLGGKCNYISNGLEREEMIKFLRDQLDQLEAHSHQQPQQMLED